jgi:hypothetical protein
MTLLFIVLSLIFSSPVFAEDTSRYEINLTKGILSLDRKDYPGATEYFQAALKEKPDDSSATLYLGIALYNSGKEQEGEKLLKEALKLDPLSPRANFELGLLYYKRGIYDEAKDFFETVKTQAPKTELSGLAGYYTNEIEKKQTKVKNWSVSLTTGIQYDSNVVLEPSDGALPEGISHKSDWRWVAYLEGKYTFLITDRLSISPTYSFYLSAQRTLDDFNVTQHLPGILMQFSIMRNLFLRVHYTFEYTSVDYQKYLVSHTIYPVVTIAEGKGFFTNLRYRYQRKHFNDTKLFPTNTERDGFNSLLGVTQYIPVHRAVLVSAGYAYDKDMAETDFWLYNGNAVDLGVRTDFGKGWVADLSGQYYCKGYKGKYPGTDRRRRDITHTYSVNLTKSINPKLHITAGWMREVNDSSIKTFDYERDIVSVMVKVQI